jgi:hypothetical protein
MTKANHIPPDLEEDDLLPEYDFSQGVRGKHHQTYRQGHSVTISHQDGTTTIQKFSSGTIAKLTAENQITLPQSVANEIEPNQYFDVKVEDGKIILTPVNIL